MTFSHLRWIPTHLPNFSSNLEELRGPSFSTLGGATTPFAPLAGATVVRLITLLASSSSLAPSNKVSRISSYSFFSVLYVYILIPHHSISLFFTHRNPLSILLLLCKSTILLSVDMMLTFSLFSQNFSLLIRFSIGLSGPYVKDKYAISLVNGLFYPVQKFHTMKHTSFIFSLNSYRKSSNWPPSN